MYISDIHFAETVKECFAFLESQGFECVSNSGNDVRYESVVLFVCIYRDPVSYEIDVEFGELNNHDKEMCSYSLFETLKKQGAPVDSSYRNYCATTNDGLRKGLCILSELIRKYIDFDHLDSAFFRSLGEQRAEQINKYAENLELRQIRRRLDEAWRLKKYHEVVELLSPHSQHLTPVERKKLSYAKQQMIH